VGLTLGLRIKQMLENKVLVLLGDGECHEGTIWEAANVACNLQLGALCAIVDWNGSAAQLMPRDDLPAKWRAFGWKTAMVDGHSETELRSALDGIEFQPQGAPTVILARTTKGKGVPLLEGHGIWHHRIPNDDELNQIMEALK
jgi:transketolase